MIRVRRDVLRDRRMALLTRAIGFHAFGELVGVGPVGYRPRIIRIFVHVVAGKARQGPVLAVSIKEARRVDEPVVLPSRNSDHAIRLE